MGGVVERCIVPRERRENMYTNTATLANGKNGKYTICALIDSRTIRVGFVRLELRLPRANTI